MSRDVKERIQAAVRTALDDAFGEQAATSDTMVTTATRPEFGDYQCNAAMPLAKKLKMKPRDAASKLVEALDVDGICEPPTIAGPGFLNLFLDVDFVQTKLQAIIDDPENLGIPKRPGTRVVIDFSSPNIAKEMHVGHLRSTIIGESLSRTFDFLGYDVLRLNHVGDWGTQFGRLILYLKEVAPEALTAEGQMDLGDLVEFYKKATKRCDDDPEFAENARMEVVKLQAGEVESLKAWNLLCDQSRREFQKIYDLLDVTVQERGESYYNPMLPGIIEHLKEKGLLAIDDGASVVYLEGYKNRDGDPQPLLVQKRDGGYNYATTDLAAAKQRSNEEKAKRVLYVVDAGQATHFQQVWQVARRAELYRPEDTTLEHVPFGLVLGEDGKKLKTRAGDTVKLKDLLSEAINASNEEFRRRLAEDNREETEEYIQNVAQVIGLSAVKYADLKNVRTSDYRFSFQRMLSLEGNTAPYMLYAYARIQGIFRKAGLKPEDVAGTVRLVEPQEVALGKLLIRLPEVLADVEESLKPSMICDYMFELSQRFSQFYQSCSIMGAATEDIKASRLVLIRTTANVIKKCLALLGIPVLERI